MSFTVTANTPKGTKLEKSMPGGVNGATITAVNDLGMVPVNPLYPREDGKTEVHQAEIIFTNPNGQAKKDATVSLHEKSFIYKLIVAATGSAPGASFDLSSLIGKNVTLITESKTSKKGNLYSKVVTVAPATAPPAVVVANFNAF